MKGLPQRLDHSIADLRPQGLVQSNDADVQLHADTGTFSYPNVRSIAADGDRVGYEYIRQIVTVPTQTYETWRQARFDANVITNPSAVVTMQIRMVI